MAYSQEFFDVNVDPATRSAQITLPPVIDSVSPQTAVDVGCGAGAWTHVLRSLGVPTVPVDGSWVPEHLRPEGFVERDLEQPLQLEGRFDLALCLEVAEHLSPARADSFVADLVRLAPTVLFSAAIPLQGGTNHMNEEWQSAWVARFAANGYSAKDLVRPIVWRNPDIEVWYAQNTLLYSREPGDPPEFVDVVHPRHYVAARRADRQRKPRFARLRASIYRLRIRLRSAL